MTKKRKKAKRAGLAGVVDTYNARKTGKGNVGNTALKSIVDVAVGVPIGVALGGVAGLWSLPFGLVLIGAGHHLNDKSGLLRITGATAIAYGIAKNIEFNEQAKKSQVNGIGGLQGASEGIKDRLKIVKEDLMAGFFLDRIFKNEESTSTKKSAFEDDDFEQGAEVGAIDTSILDIYDDYNRQEADEYEAEQALRTLPEFTPNSSLSDFDSPISEEANFGIYDEDGDSEEEQDFTDLY
jgi:hypothetical protein